MEKTVFFIRHAKSSWKNLNLRDHDRPLNKRGKRDGPIMSNIILAKEGPIQQIITSTAVRAKETAKYFAKTHGVKKKDFVEESDIYHGDTLDYLSAARVWGNDEYDQIAVFAHNPGMNYLANTFTDRYIGNVPTAGVLKVVFDVERYKEINQSNGRLEAFYYPKMFL
ncbi:MAG: histidine phosphatase family protein [Bacteroidia bacterium]|nr:histidine phosphatase family protein [Bacteroidia bacterium]